MKKNLKRAVCALLTLVMVFSLVDASLFKIDSSAAANDGFEVFKAWKTINESSYDYLMYDYTSAYLQEVDKRDNDIAWKGLLAAWRVATFNVSSEYEYASKEIAYCEELLFNLIYNEERGDTLASVFDANQKGVGAVVSTYEQLGVSAVKSIAELGEGFNKDVIITSTNATEVLNNMKKCADISSACSLLGNAVTGINMGIKLWELAEKIAKVQCLINSSKEIHSIIDAMRHACPDSWHAMKTALIEMEKITSGSVSRELAIGVFSGQMALSTALSFVGDSIYSGVVKSLGVYGVAISAAQSTGKFIANSCFGTDSAIASYYELRSNTQLEKLLKATVRAYENVALTSPAYARTFNASVNLLYKQYVAGLSSWEKFLEKNYGDSPATRILAGISDNEYRAMILTVRSLQRDIKEGALLSDALVLDEYQQIRCEYNGSPEYYTSEYMARLQEVVLTGNQRQDIVNVAKSQIGYHEGNSRKDLNGHNTNGELNFTEYGYWYGINVNNKKSGYFAAWCAMFVSWCARQAGIPTSILNNAACAGANMTLDNRFHVEYKPRGSYTPQVGDLIFFGYWNHVGLVYKVANGRVYTIEGNSSEQVVSKSYPLSSGYVQGYGIPNYQNNSEYGRTSSYRTGTYTIKVSGSLACYADHYTTSDVMYKLYNNDTVQVTKVFNKWGYTKYGWINLNYAVFKSAYKEVIVYTTGNYSVSSGSGTWVRNAKNGTGFRWLAKGTGFTITIVSGSWGYSPEQGGWICLSYAKWLSALPAVIPTPAAPSPVTTTPAVIGVGETINVSWSKVEYADRYTVKLIDAATNGVIQTVSDTKNTETTFVAPYDGTFIISVVAANEKHTSLEGKLYGIKAQEPSTVVFADWDGNVFSTQKVAYGKSAQAPAEPTRKGHAFIGWSTGFNIVSEDITVTAMYSRNSYNVTFYDYDGTTVLDTQTVLYEDAAIAPAYSAPTGYSFVRWDKDISSITSDMEVKAVNLWTSAYPLEISTSSSIYRNNTTYITTAIVNNSPYAVSDAKVIVTLNTAQGKYIAEEKSVSMSFAAGEEKTVNLSIEYEGAATVGNIFVVKADNENIPLANHYTVDVDQGTAWSSWESYREGAADGIPDDALLVETRTEYKYRTNMYTSTSSATERDSLISQGYTLKDTAVAYSEWGPFGAWQDSPITATSLVDVKTQTVPYHSGYHMIVYNTMTNSGGRQYRDYSVNGNYSAYALSSSYGEYVLERDVTIAQLNAAVKVQPGEYASGCTYPGYSRGTTTGYVMEEWDGAGSGYMFLFYVARNNYTNKTQYARRTRTSTETYTLTKWSAYSPWSPIPVEATEDVSVITRETKRYLSNKPENIEDESGAPRTVSGTVGAEYAGKYAILHICSPDGTTEYLGQTQLGASGEYSYSFKLKNEPSAETGNYTVTMSIEGTTAAFELDTIIAPVKQYIVTFKDYDGRIIETQTVWDGSNAVMPESPSRAGYNFIGWSSAGTEISEDTVITANFEIKKFEVVFIDSISGESQTTVFNYGDRLVAPEAADNEAYIFCGWDKLLDGVEYVDSSLVVRTVYQLREFNIEFLDFDGNTIESVTVNYGEGIEPPEIPESDGRVFVNWNTEMDFDFITDNAVIESVWSYSETVSEPVVDIESGTFDSAQTVTLDCDTPGATIYYTLDGSMPVEPTQESATNGYEEYGAYNGSAIAYTGPFTLDSSSTLTVAALKEGMNSSNANQELYAINTDSDSTQTYLVTVHHGINDYEYNILVEEGATVSLKDFNENGYILEGVYTDAEHTVEWDIQNGTVTQSMDLYLDWTKICYTVNFLDKDGNTISSQETLYMSNAVAPEVPETDGWIFTGWDSALNCVIDDMTVNAIYVPAASVTELTLSQSSLILENGVKNAALSVNVKKGSDSENVEVSWKSSDEDVVLVDEEGNITAVADGKASISVTASDNGATATCEVTVSAGCSHVYSDVSTVATCTEKGCLTRTCSKCGEISIFDEVPATGHTFGEWITVKEESCTVAGRSERRCHCNYVENRTIAKLGHTDSDNDGYCDRCDVQLEAEEEQSCSCSCHKSGISGFFWKIKCFIYRLFNVESKRNCACGVTHW